MQLNMHLTMQLTMQALQAALEVQVLPSSKVIPQEVVLWTHPHTRVGLAHPPTDIESCHPGIPAGGRDVPGEHADGCGLHR